MTRKDQILLMLEHNPTLTCQQITKKIIEAEELSGNVAHYLSASISSILAKMVKKGVLEYSIQNGPRGGHVYQLKTNS